VPALTLHHQPLGHLHRVVAMRREEGDLEMFGVAQTGGARRPSPSSRRIAFGHLTRMPLAMGR